MLLKIVLEPIMEPLGDPRSFGFRPGRNAHMAVSLVMRLLIYKKTNRRHRARVKSYESIQSDRKSDRKPIYLNPYVINLDIENGFDDMCHQ